MQSLQTFHEESLACPFCGAKYCWVMNIWKVSMYAKIRLLNRKIENRLHDKTRHYNAMQIGHTFEAAENHFFLVPCG